MIAMVVSCPHCKKPIDNRAPMKVWRLLPKIIPGAFLLQAISFVINPVGTWNNLVAVSNIFSVAGFVIIGLAIGFGLIAWDLARIAD